MRRSPVFLKTLVIFLLVFTVTALPQSRRIIGIIPFTNSGTPEYNWVGRGIEEILYDKFSNIDEIAIFERETLFRNLSDMQVATSQDVTRKKAFTIGKFTGIEVLVVGNYAVTDGRLALEFRLISTYTGSNILSRNNQGNLREIFDIFSQLVGESANRLQIPLNSQEQALLTGKPTHSIRAFEYYCKAYVEMAEGSTMEMIAGYFKQALKEDPNFWEAQYNLGVIYYNFDYYDTALEQLNQVIARNPDFYKPFYGKGVIYYFQRKYRSALEEFKKVLKLNPDHDRSYYYLGVIYTQIDSVATGIRHLEKAIAINPNYAPAYYHLGQADIKRGWYRKAITHLSKAVQLNPRFPQAHNAMGEAYYFLNMYEEAIIEFTRTIKLQPRFSTAYFNLANAIYKKGALEEIVEAYWGLLEARYLNDETSGEGSSTVGSFQRIREESRRENPREVLNTMISSYRKALVHDPAFYEASYNLALTYENAGQIDSAIYFYKKTIEVNNLLSQAHMRLGKLYESRGLYDLALKEYKEVVKIDPTYFAASPRLGEEYRYLNVIEVVLQEAQQKLNKNPRDPESLRVAGKIYFSLGRLGQAEEYFQQLVQLNPADNGAKETLQEIQRKLRKL